MINRSNLPGSPAAFSSRRVTTVPRLRRGRVVSFDAVSWTASVQLDGAMASVTMAVGEWATAATLVAGARVAVALFNDSNPKDGLVLGVY